MAERSVYDGMPWKDSERAPTWRGDATGKDDDEAVFSLFVTNILEDCIGRA